MTVLALHAWYYSPFMVDDAFISLRYADRFLHGHGLTWNDGEIVEGYSNLLWVLGCALLRKLGLDLVVAARVLGFMGSGAAIAAVVWTYRGSSARAVLPGLAGGLALALSGSVAIWTVGGLEQPLIAGLLAWAVALCYPLLDEPEPRFRRLAAPGLLLGLIVITRPDGVVLAVAAGLGFMAARGLSRGTIRTAVDLAVLPAIFFLTQLAFRVAYYHDWLPNSAYAKLSLTPERFATGMVYLAGGGFLSGLLVPSLLPFFVKAPSPAHARRVRFLGAILMVWLAYVVAVGGDFFPGRRQLVPAIVILAFLCALSFSRWISTRGKVRSMVWVGAACLALFGFVQFLDDRNIVAYHERWVWDGDQVGGLLSEAFGAERPLLAVDPAGCLPYFSHLPSVDMLGINDRYLAHHRPAHFGTGIVGHELGSGAYVLSRRPDLVLFNLPTGNLKPYFRSGREMILDPRFRSAFRPVQFECKPPGRLKSLIWVRVEDGAIGIHRSDRRVVVPGFLLSSNPSSVARLDPEGRIGVAITPDAPARLGRLPLAPGRWLLRTESSGTPLGIEVWNAEVTDTLATGADRVAFTLSGGDEEKVSLSIATAGVGEAHLRAVTLERLD